MPTDRNLYSEDVWLHTDTEDRWRRFMGHDHMNPSRFLGYYLVAEHYWKKDQKYSLAEIGFGDCCDFRFAFKHMHDRGLIDYTGYEIMPNFVQYALTDFYPYRWRHGGFLDLQPDSYDITYTRHTLEHVHPMLWRKCLARMLRATRELAIITWYMPPWNLKRMTKNWTGEGWQNHYCIDDVMRLIKGLGYTVEIWTVATNEVWSLKREEE